VNPVPLKEIPLRPNPFAGLAPKAHRILFALFLIQWTLVWARLWLPRPPFGDARWPDGLLVVLATATLLASLTCQLPGQNVMLAAVVIAFIAGAVETLGALTGIPFGPFVYTDAIGQQLFHPLPWAVPMVWLVALLASRGVARLALRPWRNTPNYGYWLIGTATLLVVLLDVGLEPFATQVKHFWHWNPTRIRLDWYTAPCVNFLGWAVTTLLILAFATPALINKKPMKQPPPDYHPLAVWLLLNLLFATGAAVNRLWLAMTIISLGSLTVALFAVRGGASGLKG
jgi:putative membrane protein